jgi:5-methyltetrahydropteroyltriglutamate--homocysteine methyltransferase
VRRAQGEAVDPTALAAAAGREALRWVVPKQIAAGLDVGSNGEQQREGFFLYVQHRMSGFAGAWQRRPRGDVIRYTMFQRMLEEQMAGRSAVSNFQPPQAIGPVRYLDQGAVDAECEDFCAILEQTNGGFVEPFLTAPWPGIVAAAMQNRHYATEEAYLEALADALRVEYEAIVGHGFVLQLDCPDLALERHITCQDRPPAEFQGFVERVVRRSIGGSSISRASACACTFAGATARARTIWTYRSLRSCRSSGRPWSAASCSRSPIPGTPTSTTASKVGFWTTIRSSSPA